MSFLNQKQQDTPYRVENTFLKGLVTDAATDATPNTILTYAKNVHLLRQQGSELILATEPGMQRVCYLPPNHVVHGYAERQGVLYLLLAEYSPDTLLATGSGQLGTFPSPDYQYLAEQDADSELVETGSITNDYRPLQVYYGDFNGYRPTGLQSVHFQLSLDTISELELQDSYDGTLNIIINDRGQNPALLVNSGFVVLPNSQYRIVLRQGDASTQTNRYTHADFTSRLRLFPRGSTIAKARLVDVAEGGKLRGGEYTYYFTYCDADDNQTSICCELGPVYVGKTSSSSINPASSEGSRPGEAGSLRVRVQLSQLDPTLGYVRVSYAYRSGEPSAVGEAWELNEKLRVGSDGRLDFLHTGYSTEAGLSLDQLQHAAGSVSAFATMCQSGNHLLLGNIRQDLADNTGLAEFARQLRLGYEQVSLNQVPGLEDTSTLGESLYQPLAQQQQTGTPQGVVAYDYSRAGWAGGYLNPLNSTYRLGYRGGESYVFGVRFILDDYSLSETYPLAGFDNVSGQYSEGSYNQDENGTLYGSDGWSQSVPWQNRNGVYRFPLAVKGQGPAVKPLVAGNGSSLNILAARVQLPSNGLIPEDLRKRCVGVQFMRAARQPNCVAQGYLVPTVRALAVSPGDVYDHLFPDMAGIYTGATGNLKVLPAVRGTLEGVVRNYGNHELRGVFPFKFSNHLAGGSNSAFDNKRWAFYSPDALLQPSAYLPALNEQQLQVKLLTTVYVRAAERYDNPTEVGYGSSTSLCKTISQQPLSGGDKYTDPQPAVSATAYWTLDDQPAVNRGHFGSQEKDLTGKNADGGRVLVGLSFDPYLGVQLDQAPASAAGDWLNGLTLPTSNSGTGYEASEQVAQELTQAAQPTAYVANLYNRGGLLTTEQLRGVYPASQVQQLSYAPISERLSWSELESQLDANNTLLLYGGDTFVGVSYRRWCRSLQKSARRNDDYDAPAGQVLSIVCESSVNPYLRSTDVSSTSALSSGASFLPLLGASTRNFNLYRGSDTYQQPESTRYNAGYTSWGSGPGNEQSSALPLVLSPAAQLDAPYRNRQFASRVWASAVSVDGSFNNGYRFLPPLSFKDYERSLGSIVRLLSVGSNQVLVVHEHGLELLGLNEQTLTGQNQAGPVYAEALNLLPSQGRIISRELGCQHPLGVCVSPRGVYGIDVQRQCYWFWPLGGGEGSVKRLSDFNVSQLLRPVLKNYQQRPVSLLNLDVRVVYDPARADVIFSLYHNT